MWDNGYPEYVSVAQKKLRAHKKIAALRKKGQVLSPIRIEGRTLARNWWGKAWNGNLALYADYANRLDRGRGYILHDAVLDLKISKGIVEGLVQGSASSPYRVKVAIAALSDRNRAAVRKACEGKIGSMQDLFSGKIPKELQVLFTAKGTGLFPAPKEITFGCSCPDSASLCKHVAAVLYGVGARLDEQPEGFFTLRGVAVSELVSEAIVEKIKDLLGRSARPSRRVMAVDDISALFGIELAESVSDSGLTGASDLADPPDLASKGNAMPAEPTPIKRSRGRPRKVISVVEAAKPVALPMASPSMKAAALDPTPVRRKRGRPLKNASVMKVAVPEPMPVKAKRGRPPKASAAVPPAKSMQTAKKRGRPRKNP